MARLDWLTDVKAVAQLAATIGRQFSYDLLRAVSPWDDATLQDGLQRLVATGLCYQSGAPPQSIYIFKHALIQEAAYESLLKRQRQTYHQHIAQRLEEQFPETVRLQPELLAHHYTQAGVAASAVPYWRQASKQALDRAAPLEAIAHQRQGLAVLETLPETLDRQRQELSLQLELGPTVMMARGFTSPEVEHLYARARELSHQLGDATSRFQALRGLCRVYHIRRDLRRAHELGLECLHLAECHQSPDQLIETYKLMGIIQALRGELRTAHTHFEQALNLYDPHQHRRLIDLYGEDPGVVCQTRMAYVLWQLGYPDQAHQCMQAALALAIDQEHNPSRAYVLNHAARLYQLRREPRAAHDYMVAAISVADESGLAPWYTAPMSVWLGWSRDAQGEAEAGLADLRQGLEEWEIRGMSRVNPYFLALWAETYCRVGDVAGGQRVLTEAFEVLERTEENAEAARLHGIRGELFLMQGVSSYPVAERSFQEALSVAREQQAKSFELRAAIGLGRLWQLQGRGQEAKRLIARVYEQFTEGFNTPDLRDAKTMLEALETG